MLDRRRMLVSRSRRWPRIWIASLAALALVVLSACANRNAASESSSDGSTGVRIMSTSATFTDLPTIVASAQGYFEQVGLDATVDYGASNASLITQAVISGDADIGSSGSGALYNAYAEGMTNLVSMGTTNHSITFGLALNQQTIDTLAAQGVTPDSPAADRVQALRGLTITASPEGSTGNSYLRMMLSEYGVDPDTDLTILPNNDASAQIASAKTERANGFAQSFPRAQFPEAEGWGGLWLNWAQDLPQILPLASHDYYTTRTWLAENPDLAKQVMQAIWLAQNDLQEPTDELRDKVRATPAFADLNQDAFNSGWELAVAAYKGVTPLTTQEGFDNEVALVNYSRDVPVTFKFEDIYDLSAAEAGKPEGQ